MRSTENYGAVREVRKKGKKMKISNNQEASDNMTEEKRGMGWKWWGKSESSVVWVLWST